MTPKKVSYTVTAAATAASSQQVIPFATFPDALPHIKEHFFLSIVVGQTHLHWAMHEGYDGECKATVFWKTTLTTLPELKRTYNCPSDALSHHIPIHWRYYFFGGTKDAPKDSTKENLLLCSWKRPVPTVHAYVVTLGSRVDESLLYLFEDLPSRLYQLSPSHFWPEACCDYVATDGDDNADGDAAAAEDDLYGIELHRRANLKGAVALCGHPALVMDGGSFHGLWNYTATDANGRMLGGGFSANMAFSWLVLQQSTGKLPLLQYADLMKKYPQLGIPIVEVATTTTEEDGTTVTSIHATVPPAASEAEGQRPRVSGFAKSTEDAILEDALLTLGLRCRYVLNHWLNEVGKAEAMDDRKPAAREDTGKGDQTTTAVTSQGNQPTATASLQEGDLQRADASNEVESPVEALTQPTTPAAATESGQQTALLTAEGDNPTSDEAVPPGRGAMVTTMEASVKDPPSAVPSSKEDVNGALKAEITRKAPEKNRQRFVVLTGAEKEFMVRLLQPDHGGVLEVDPKVAMPVVDQDFAIHANKHLVTYAIEKVIHEEQVQLVQVELNHVAERMRRDLMGLRVAVEFEKAQYPDGDLWYRGSVIKIRRGIEEGKNWTLSLADDLYWIRFDDGDNQELNPYELYCALMKYDELGEREYNFTYEKSEDIKLQRQEKRRDSKMYAEELRKYSPLVQHALAKAEAANLRKAKVSERQRRASLRQVEQEGKDEEAKDDAVEMDEAVEEQEEVEDEKEAAEEEDEEEVEHEKIPEGQEDVAITEKKRGRKSTPSRGSNKKSPTTSTAQKSTRTSSTGRNAKSTPTSSSRKQIKQETGSSPPRAKRVKKTDAESAAFVGRRVAKKFDDGNVYFGQVSSFSPGDPDDPKDEDYWWINYDDGDTEQFDTKDMQKGFRLYTTKKNMDKKGAK